MNIVVLPILFEGEVKAVMELSSLDRFNSTHQAFLDQLAESIGIVLHTIEANTRTEDLLNQSQSLATELQEDRNSRAAGKSALQSGERSVPRHAQPRVAHATYAGARFGARARNEKTSPENMQESLANHPAQRRAGSAAHRRPSRSHPNQQRQSAAQLRRSSMLTRCCATPSRFVRPTSSKNISLFGSISPRRKFISGPTLRGCSRFFGT